MSSLINPVRPFSSLKTILRTIRAERNTGGHRLYATAQTQAKPPRIQGFHPGDIYRKNREQAASLRPIKTFPSPPAATTTCADPIATLTSTQLSILDPRGVRSRLFAKENPDQARVGDILLVRSKNGDPYSGVCINIRRRGIDTSILLRNQLTRVGVEVWFKVYSPGIEGIEVVQRALRRPRRARLYYMRHSKHDRGSVENITRQYLRQRAGLRSRPGLKTGTKK